MAFGLSIDGIPALEKELERMSSIRWEAIRKKQTVQLLNRARASGGTPVSTEATRPGGPHGELRLSAGTSGETMGYTKEYAPHVEYGHRTVNGGYVEGQYYLKRNVDTQRLIYKQDLLNAIRKGKA